MIAKEFNELLKKHKLDESLPLAIAFNQMGEALLPLLDNILTRLEAIENWIQKEPK